ncbi:MAG: GNAT family N-acetyltransferase [candidate division Zixibacteria bacterium]
MPKITYRHPTQDELLPACRVMAGSYLDLQARSGRKVPEKPDFKETPAAVVHMYKTDYKGCWVVYSGNRMVGYGQALMRGKQWYLANLFVETRAQNGGVGRELMKRCLNYGRQKNADSFALCTFPYNEVALGLYAGFGIMPQYPIFEMRNTNTVTRRIQPTGLHIDNGNSNSSILRINRLEKKIRGYARLVDLRFFAGEPDYEILDFYRGPKWVGYSVIHKRGLIAPSGAIVPKYLPDIVTESFRRTLKYGSKMSIIFAGGSNAQVHNRLRTLGFKIDSISVFLATKQYADFSRYIPAHLALF